MKPEWKLMYIMKVKKATKNDDGVRAVMYNEATKEFKYQVLNKIYRKDERARSPYMYEYTDEKTK